MFIFKLKTWLLGALILGAILTAEQFVFIPLFGSSVEGVAQWNIRTVPLAIEQLDLLYNIRATSMEYSRRGYAVYDMELRLVRLKKDFAPQKIEFLVQMYDKQDKVLLERDLEENLFIITQPNFAPFDTAKVTLPEFVLDREPARIKIWIRGYVDADGQVKEILKTNKKYKNERKNWRWKW